MEDKENYMRETLRKLPVPQILKQICLRDLLWDFDGVMLYPSAIWDDKSIYPELETHYVFTEDLNI